MTLGKSFRESPASASVETRTLKGGLDAPGPAMHLLSREVDLDNPLGIEAMWGPLPRQEEPPAPPLPPQTPSPSCTHGSPNH